MLDRSAHERLTQAREEHRFSEPSLTDQGHLAILR
jgi:hypothetical protein